MSQIYGVVIILLILFFVVLGIQARVVHKGGVLEQKKPSFFRKYVTNKITLGVLFLLGLLFQERAALCWGLLGIILAAYLIEGYWYIFTGQVRLRFWWQSDNNELREVDEVYPKVIDDEDSG